MKKVMLIIPTLTGGGAEKTIGNLSHTLKEKYEIYVVVFNLENKTYDCSGKIISLDSGYGGNILKKVLRNIYRMYKIKKLKKNLKIDISISFLDTPNILNVITKTKDKIIVSIRNLQSKTDNNIIHKKLSEFFMKKSDKIISLSELVKEDIMNNYLRDESKIHTIYNPCPFEIIKNRSLEKLDFNYEEKLFNGELNLLTCGRLEKQKGQWHLIRIMAELIKKGLNIKLFILGQGSLENKLKKLVEDYNLEENVIFLGFKKNPYKYIKKADLFVFSSIYEGLGNILLETLACQVPIISSNCLAGPAEILLKNKEEIIKSYNQKEVIYGDYGILVPSFKNDNFDSITLLNQEEEILKNLLIECYRNKNIYEKYKEKSKERIKDFSEEKIGQEWIKIMEELLIK